MPRSASAWRPGTAAAAAEFEFELELTFGFGFGSGAGADWLELAAASASARASAARDAPTAALMAPLRSATRASLHDRRTAESLERSQWGVIEDRRVSAPGGARGIGAESLGGVIEGAPGRHPVRARLTTRPAMDSLSGGLKSRRA